MVIQIKNKSKIYFLQVAASRTQKQPSITPYRSKALVFNDLNRCKPVRDDVLEYFPNAVIIA